MRLVHRCDGTQGHTSCGASNISFGLPNRDGINSAFSPWRWARHDLRHHNPLHVEVIKR